MLEIFHEDRYAQRAMYDPIELREAMRELIMDDIERLAVRLLGSDRVWRRIYLKGSPRQNAITEIFS